MRPWRAWLRALPVGAMLASVGAGAADRPADAGVERTHVMIPMRDGVRLSAFVYRPAGEGPWPVLYQQRFSELENEASRERGVRMAARGYVVVDQNFRGTRKSEGEFSGYMALAWGEKRDGFDTVEWLAAQPWCNGRIGTYGGSQAGYAQNFLAVTRPPHLVCQFITDGGADLFGLGYRLGGITRPKRFETSMVPAARDPAEAWRFLAEQFRHPNYDEYWAAQDASRHFSDMDVPAMIIASWFDFMSVGGIDTYRGRQHAGGPGARQRQQLVIGPWVHGENKTATKVGDLAFPANASLDVVAAMLDWFDAHLRAAPAAAAFTPPVRYYAMGAVGEPGAPGNEWRTAEDWPVPAQQQAVYLTTGGQLSVASPTGDARPTEFLSDPFHPAPMPGRVYPASRDGRAWETDPNVRTFTSEELPERVEWTGKVAAELFVSSSAPDTDFIVRVSDVYPDGRSIMLIDSIRRARYRDSFTAPSLLVPGRVYRIAFDVGWISQIFNRHHRIRVSIGSTGADFYEPNPNTGEALGPTPPANTVVARNRLYHDSAHASRIIAPLRPPAPSR